MATLFGTAFLLKKSLSWAIRFSPVNTAALSPSLSAIETMALLICLC